MRKIYLTGQKFNWFTVESENFTKNVTAWNCRCDCGQVVVVRSGDLKSGRSKSCLQCGAKRHGEKIQKNNNYKVIDGVAYIDVSTKTQKGELLVDACDLPLVFDGNGGWGVLRAKGMAYAHRRNSTQAHRVIMAKELSDGLIVDHINGNGLDCRRCNMRVTTQQNNCRNSAKSKRNTSGVNGVCFHKRIGKWQVRIGNGALQKEKHVGYFDDFDKAVSARMRAEVELGYHKNHGREKVEY